MPREEEVKQRNDGTFKLGSTASAHGGRGEGLSDNRLVDVSGDEQVDAGSEAVTFLRGSSKRITMRAVMMSWMMLRRQMPAPRSLGWPYKAVRT